MNSMLSCGALESIGLTTNLYYIEFFLKTFEHSSNVAMSGVLFEKNGLVGLAGSFKCHKCGR